MHTTHSNTQYKNESPRLAEFLLEENTSNGGDCSTK